MTFAFSATLVLAMNFWGFCASHLNLAVKSAPSVRPGRSSSAAGRDGVRWEPEGSEPPAGMACSVFCVIAG